mmetsp:Transcript_16216/g.23466  ORF Transcript_16216/g.23466 Transcript_16216/m.23466 type:complete len:126 (+) Transcript_16216:886-1263(+)|eukprot:CAMPEP_0202429852 /NCGR_PEP_ID=MMETSP1345-20130828/3469_1 /ASSEMBLY_ACC=CAM_ASM_000843 /TAXON_ID=342563 /ORGANISM="Fabrea Fabrea salina" /LENGTH=125 /DNA_ID=CAMNT_0049041193 /DNA_START=853 /DNA_END=1230 /DNA_ORIENTATION=-
MSQEVITALVNLETQFTESEFICQIEDLLNSNLHEFDSGEQTLKAYEVFQEYSSAIETKLEDFLSKEGLTEEELFFYIQKIYNEDPNSLTCLEYILSACDYQDFLEMVLTRKNLQEWTQTEQEVK